MMKKSIGSGRGSVYNVLLKALQSGDKYAYEICKEIEEKTNGAYVLKEQSSYSGLRRLEQRNEITSYWKDSTLGGKRHYYSLTEKGKQRLENSHFSWEDTRKDIIDNLFDQSELDKKINNVATDIENIKATIENQNQNDIDEIIHKTDELAKEQDSVNADENFEDENEQSVDKNDFFGEHARKQTDLFSIFAYYSTDDTENNDEIEKNHSEQTENQNDIVDDKNLEANEFVEDTKPADALSFVQNDTAKVQSDTTDNQNLAEKSAEILEEQNEQPIKNNEEIENKADFDEVINNLKTVDSNLEAENEKPEKNCNNLDKSDTDIDFYRQMYKNANNYVESTYEEKSSLNFFADFDEANNLQFDNKTDADFSNDKINKFERVDLNQNYFDNELAENHNEAEQSNEQTQKTIDYRDIFGDLISNQKDEKMSNNENQSVSTNKNEFDGLKQSEFYSTGSESDFTENRQFQNQDNFEVLNDKQSSNDINRTLIFETKSRIDDIYEMQNAYNSNNQEDDLAIPNQKFDTLNNVSFDKKYNNLENNFDVPNYKIRYHQRSSEKRQSKYLLANKLNLISTLMLCMLLAICNTITLLISKSLNSPNFQIVFCNIFYVIIAICLLVYLIIYIKNPSKRTYKLCKYDIIISASLSALIVVLTFMFNILAGMTLINLSEYLASLVMPIFFSIALLLSHATKKVLSKSSKFYK